METQQGNSLVSVFTSEEGVWFVHWRLVSEMLFLKKTPPLRLTQLDRRCLGHLCCCSAASDSLRPHGLQHCRLLLCLPELAQIHVHWVSDAIQPSHPLLPPSPPALSLSQGGSGWNLVIGSDPGHPPGWPQRVSEDKTSRPRPWRWWTGKEDKFSGTRLAAGVVGSALEACVPHSKPAKENLCLYENIKSCGKVNISIYPRRLLGGLNHTHIYTHHERTVRTGGNSDSPPDAQGPWLELWLQAHSLSNENFKATTYVQKNPWKY